MKKRLSTIIDLDDKLLKRIRVYCVNNEITYKEFVTKAMIEKAISLKIFNEK